MKTRFEIHEGGKRVFDLVCQSRNRYVGLHELLRVHRVKYNPTQFKEDGDWLCFLDDEGTLYRTSTRFG